MAPLSALADSCRRMAENRELRERVGTNIKRLRKLCGQTQEQLAERLDITTRHLFDLESGGFDIGVDLMGSVAQALEVDPAEFFRIVDDSEQDATYWLTPHELEKMQDAWRVAERVRRRRSRKDSH